MGPQECSVHKLVADVCILAEGQVLLVRYQDLRKYDGQTGWFLPDDFLEYEEHPNEAAARILRQQAGVPDQAATLSHIESFGNGGWHLIFHYKLEWEKARTVPVLGNVKEAQWFLLSELPEPEQVGHQGWALETIRRVYAGE